MSRFRKFVVSAALVTALGPMSVFAQETGSTDSATAAAQAEWRSLTLAQVPEDLRDEVAASYNGTLGEVSEDTANAIANAKQAAEDAAWAQLPAEQRALIEASQSSSSGSTSANESATSTSTEASGGDESTTSTSASTSTDTQVAETTEQATQAAVAHWRSAALDLVPDGLRADVEASYNGELGNVSDDRANAVANAKAQAEQQAWSELSPSEQALINASFQQSAE